jgi:hypothetical protein
MVSLWRQPSRSRSDVPLIMTNGSSRRQIHMTLVTVGHRSWTPLRMVESASCVGWPVAKIDESRICRNPTAPRTPSDEDADSWSHRSDFYPVSSWLSCKHELTRSVLFVSSRSEVSRAHVRCSQHDSAPTLHHVLRPFVAEHPTALQIHLASVLAIARPAVRSLKARRPRDERQIVGRRKYKQSIAPLPTDNLDLA